MGNIDIFNESDPIVAALGDKAEIFLDLKEQGPVILASGLLANFYIYCERFVQDMGAWNNSALKANSEMMIRHAVQFMNRNPAFYSAVNQLAERVDHLFGNTRQEFRSVSGGQTRDWLFSGPVANILNIPHISVYKQVPEKESRIQVLKPGLFPAELRPDFVNIQVADLLMRGSSEYRLEQGVEKGWLPWMGGRGIKTEHIVFMVDRMDKTLEGIMMHDLLQLMTGVKSVSAMIYINETYLRGHSKDIHRALDFLSKGSERWTREYLQNNGALRFVEDFSPTNPKPDKPRAFILANGEYLKKIGRLQELEQTVQNTYGRTIKQITGVDVS